MNILMVNSTLKDDELIKKLEVISKMHALNEPEVALFINRSITAIRELRYKHKIPYVQDWRRIQPSESLW